MKRALLVGLNHYPNPANNLRGCVNDVLQTSRMLQEHYGFDDARQIRVLTDARATTANIVRRLEWLVEDSRPGDVLLFHYSGHGSQVRDRDGDELDDGLDEIICPYDLDWDAPFTDDDMRKIVERVAPGANLTVLLDCCHSGTGLRVLETDSAEHARVLHPRSKCLTPPPDILHRAQPVIEDRGENRRLTMTRLRQELSLRRFGEQAAAQGAVLLAACGASQSSADAWIEGDYHGAFTYYLWKAVEAGAFTASCGDVMRRARGDLRKAGYEQIPQLEGPAALLGLPVLGAVAVL